MGPIYRCTPSRSRCRPRLFLSTRWSRPTARQPSPSRRRRPRPWWSPRAADAWSRTRSSATRAPHLVSKVASRHSCLAFLWVCFSWKKAQFDVNWWCLRSSARPQSSSHKCRASWRRRSSSRWPSSTSASSLRPVRPSRRSLQLPRRSTRCNSKFSRYLYVK